MEEQALYECQMCDEKFVSGIDATNHRREKNHLIRINAKPENKKKLMDEILGNGS